MILFGYYSPNFFGVNKLNQFSYYNLGGVAEYVGKIEIKNYFSPDESTLELRFAILIETRQYMSRK